MFDSRHGTSFRKDASQRCHGFRNCATENVRQIKPLGLLRTLDGADAGDAADAENHAVEVMHVFSFDDKLDDGFVVFCFADVDITNVGVVVGNHGREFFEHAGAVVAEDRDFNRVALRAAGGLVTNTRPLDGDAAIAFVEQVLHVWATARMHSDALAARDVADDLFTANGIATSRAIDEQVVLAFNLERVRAGEV